MTPVHVQKLVVGFHEARGEFGASPVREDLRERRARNSEICRPVVKE